MQLLESKKTFEEAMITCITNLETQMALQIGVREIATNDSTF